MKKFFALTLVLALIVVGCKKEPEPTKDSIKLNTETWTASYEGEAVNLTVTASGDFTPKSDVDWITVSGSTVTVAPNPNYEPRTGKVTFTCGEATATLTVNQDAAPKPKVYTELDGPANSYVITAAGDYKIKATVMGNGDAGLHSTFPITSTAINPAGAELVWTEVNDLITDIQLKDGYICFSVPKALDGNALVAATAADGTILWSWHIWSTEGFSTVAIPDTPWELMDRNLGALGSTAADGEAAFGMYYQWGRKDPFSRVIGFEGSEYSYPCTEKGAGEDNTISYSIANPNVYIAHANTGDNGDWLVESNNWLWGSNTQDPGVWNDKVTSFKALFDPCPKGYRVASMWALNTAYGPDNSYCVSVDGGITLGNGGIIFIPNSSFIYCVGHGWWDPYATVWTDQSAAWGDKDKEAFRAVPGDAHMNYPRGFGQAVRCMKHAE
ncbi:MAG: BACON domain-containing protein [Bacteroidales bacterium]|nr:BACON domain-containing protein [Bacteroidales bacterium]